MHRGAEVQRQSLALAGDHGVVALAWSSVASGSPSWAPCHPTGLFSVKCVQTPGPHHASPLSGPLPFCSFLPCSISVFLYLLQRSGKQINEEKDPIILRPDSRMGGGEGSRSIK